MVRFPVRNAKDKTPPFKTSETVTYVRIGALGNATRTTRTGYRITRVGFSLPGHVPTPLDTAFSAGGLGGSSVAGVVL